MLMMCTLDMFQPVLSCHQGNPSYAHGELLMTLHLYHTYVNIVIFYTFLGFRFTFDSTHGGT